MTNFWLKLRLWTKVIVFGLLALYLIIFVSKNWDATIDPKLDFIFVSYSKPPVLYVLLFTALISIFGWWFFRMIFLTIRQFRELRERNRTARIEKEMAEMRAKAGMLQTRETTPAAPAPPPAETKPPEAGQI